MKRYATLEELLLARDNEELFYEVDDIFMEVAREGVDNWDLDEGDDVDDRAYQICMDSRASQMLTDYVVEYFDDTHKEEGCQHNEAIRLYEWWRNGGVLEEELM